VKNRIVIVDGDPGIQDILKIIFDRAGFETIVFSDGNAVLNTKYEMPDIFLLDMQIAGINGLDICRQLKTQKKTKDIPVIIISATSGIEKLAKSAGANDFIEKPFKRSELLDKAAQALKNGTSDHK
jgi:DNA-binding response OmpR family regulator